MRREIIDFYSDKAGDWVALLVCGHGQHVRHQPPFFSRPWIVTESGRRTHLGSSLDCPRCDRLEIPDEFVSYKRTKTFDEGSLPEALLKKHVTKEGVWARIRCLEGRLRYSIADPLNRVFELDPEHDGIVPPEVPHWIEPLGRLKMTVTFYRSPKAKSGA